MRYDEMLGLLPRLWAMKVAPGVRLFVLELLFWALVAIFTIVLARYRPRLIERAEAGLLEVSRHKRFWLATFVLGVISVRLALLHWLPIPVPFVHDELSYLLASDTFAHGRLTNPTNPMWVHFETFHINMQPTYQSMYPPAQGMALAVGQVLTGQPWVGALLSVALMCGAIYWMLLGWVPVQWAWLGGAFVCVRFGVFSYWVNSYWGGAVAALGGALVLGAFPRFRNGPKIQMGLVLAFGLLILANSRPMEGFLFSLPLVLGMVILLIDEIRSGKATLKTAARVVLPASALLVLGLGWMLYYNWRGTGHPNLMPYQVNYQVYHFSKPFLFEKANPVPEYRHLSMRLLYVHSELPAVLLNRYDTLALVERTVRAYYGFFIWPFALLVAPCTYAMWSSKMRPVLVSVILPAVFMLTLTWPPQPHYAAPITGALILMLLVSIRRFRNSFSTYSLWGSRAIVILLGIWMISPVAEALFDPLMSIPNFTGAEAADIKEAPMPSHFRRAAIRSQLNALSQKQLVIVHYPFAFVPWDEWVYNEADIDHAHIVWARDMGYRKNRELLNYYPDRQVWYVDRGDPSIALLPYQQAMEPLKLAYERPPGSEDSPQVASAGQRLSPAMVKPVSTGLAEIAAPGSR